jgi:hypothetical protein
MNKQYVITYHNGDKWATLTHPTRFWEPRRYPSKAAAEDAIAGFKKEAPGFFRFHALMSR